jgi:hypothetical protein
MRLDYSVPNFQFLIGNFDCTNYLDEISLSLPMHEIGQILTWTGRIRVSYNRAAIKAGLAEGDFDPWVTPGRWRPTQVPVTLKIKGHTLPIMRIDRYAYNHQNQAGEGTLHQILDAVAFDQPAEVQVGGATISGIGALPVTSVAAIVDRLIGEAFRGAMVAPPRLTGGQAGLIYGLIYSRNPIQDAQKLCGAQWQWLTVDALERILAINGSPPPTPLFTRTLGQIEWEPDVDHLNFAAQRVIVTGSHQQPAKVKCPDEPLNPVLDRKGRPKLQKTIERQPFNQVFAKNNGGSIAPTTSEVKWIFYQYPDELSWDSQLYQFVPTDLLFDLQSDKPVDGAAIDSPCQTVTVAQWPAGRIFSKLGTDTSLAVYSLEIQSERRRGRFVPAGVLKPSLGNVFSLSEERYEILTTKPVEPGNNHAGVVDPKTGQSKCLEPLPKAEERKPLAELPLETVAVRGLAYVAPPNWVPIIRQDLIMEVGFLPSDASANYLAEQVAKREAWRRDSVKVTMPIPDEWLVAGCPPLRRCYLQDGNWQMDGLIVSMQAGEAKFAFTAARIDRLGEPAMVAIENILFNFIIEADAALDTVNLAIGQFIVEAEIAVQSSSQVGSAFINQSSSLQISEALPVWIE